MRNGCFRNGGTILVAGIAFAAGILAAIFLPNICVIVLLTVLLLTVCVLVMK